MRPGEGGIPLGRLSEVAERRLQVLRAPAVPEVAASEVQVVRLQVLRRTPHDGALLASPEPYPQLLHDRTGDLLPELAVVRLRPQVRVGARVHELGSDPELLAVLADAPLEHMRNVQLLGDLLDGDAPSLEREGRRASGHPKARKSRQRVQDLLGDPVAEVLLVASGAQVCKGEDHERGGLGGRCRDGRPRLRGSVGGFGGAATDNGRHRSSRDDEERAQHHQLDPPDTLVPTLAVVPGEHHGREEAHSEHGGHAAHHRLGPDELSPYHIGDLDQRPRAGQVGDGPLDELPVPQAVPETAHA